MDIIDKEELLDLLSDVAVPILKAGSPNGQPALASAKEIYRNYRDVIPKPVVSKLGQRTAAGDRSKVLWKLTNALLECGLSAGEVVVLVEGTVWNKFGEDRGRLWADVNKAASRLRPAKRRKKRQIDWSIALDRYLAVESRDPQWMIEGLWSDKSHGIIAGEPKTRKSYVAIDIALSVATGTDCLGHFPVVKAGSVLMIQEEISDSEMRKRLRYIADSKGLAGEVSQSGKGISVKFPDPIPLHLRNRKGLDLSSEDTFRELEREITDKHIRLLILDPLQLMLGTVDENQASQVRPVLYNFLQLKEATGCGVLIVHHYSKASEKNPKWGGQRMLGSQAFHGWVETGLYLERSKDRRAVTRVEREFRNFDDIPEFEIEYVGGNEAYEIEISEEEARKPPDAFEKFCLKHRGVSYRAIARHLDLAGKTCLKQIEASSYVDVEDRVGPHGGRPAKIVIRRRGKRDG